MSTEKIQTETDNNTKQNRDFVRHKVYTPRNLNIQYDQNKPEKTEKTEKYKYGYNGNYDNYNRDNKFRFKNSLIITPFYETEFNVSGGIKYIKDHRDCVFFTDDSIFATTNDIQKIPVLIKREINKQSAQKKLIVEEKYNYEEKYEIYKNIILYYEENRIDFQILFNKLESVRNTKDITTEFSLNLSVPGISESTESNDTVTYKKYSEKQEYKTLLTSFTGYPNISESSDPLEYLVIGCGKHDDSCMTLYPDKKLLTECRDKSLNFAVSNHSQPQKNYINLKIYLENYRVT